MYWISLWPLLSPRNIESISSFWRRSLTSISHLINNSWGVLHLSICKPSSTLDCTIKNTLAGWSKFFSLIITSAYPNNSRAASPSIVIFKLCSWCTVFYPEKLKSFHTLTSAVPSNTLHFSCLLNIFPASMKWNFRMLSPPRDSTKHICSPLQQ